MLVRPATLKVHMEGSEGFQSEQEVEDHTSIAVVGAVVELAHVLIIHQLIIPGWRKRKRRKRRRMKGRKTQSLSHT